MANDMFDDPLMMTVDASDVEEGDFEGGGGSCDKEGYYHLLAHRVQGEGDGVEKLPCIRIDFEILAGDHEDQKGRYVFHRIYTAKWANKDDHSAGTEPMTKGAKVIMLKFAEKLGLITRDQAAGNGKVPINWAMAEGRQVVGKVGKEKREGRDRPDFRINFADIWPLDDPAVEKVKKDPEALALIGGIGGDGGGDDLADL